MIGISMHRGGVWVQNRDCANRFIGARESTSLSQPPAKNPAASQEPSRQPRAIKAATFQAIRRVLNQTTPWRAGLIDEAA